MDRIVSMPTPPMDYRPFVDEEVRNLFKSASFMNWEPLMYQLHLDIDRKSVV